MAIPLLLACMVSLLLAEAGNAHGGVVQEDDLCVIKVDFLRAHFKIYQPRRSGHKQFCEDLPAASESVFVMEYQHDALRDMPIDFRIIRDVTGKGRFARMEDVTLIADLESATVFHQAAAIDPDVFTVIHDFSEEGEFIGIVSATERSTGEVYAAVFPFEVGFTGIGYWPYFIAVLVLLQLQYLFMSGRLGRWFRGKPAPAALLALGTLLLMPFSAALADTAGLRVTYTTPEGPPVINQIHTWILHVETAQGEPVNNARIEVVGGMPEHDHGLPTRPKVTEALGGGDYRLEGMRFHMQGRWEISVTIVTDDLTSVVVIPLSL